MFRNSLLATILTLGAIAGSSIFTPAEAAMKCNAGFVQTGGNQNSINCAHVQPYPSQAAAVAGNIAWKNKVGCNTGMYGPATLKILKVGPTWQGGVTFVCLGIT